MPHMMKQRQGTIKGHHILYKVHLHLIVVLIIIFHPVVS